MEFKVGKHTHTAVTCEGFYCGDSDEGINIDSFSQQDHVCELLNTIDACQVFFDIVSVITKSSTWPGSAYVIFVLIILLLIYFKNTFSLGI